MVQLSPKNHRDPSLPVPSQLHAKQCSGGSIQYRASFRGAPNPIVVSQLDTNVPVNSKTQMDARILIVEDEGVLVTPLKYRLRKEGYSVTVTRDEKSGLDLATREPFSLIVLDFNCSGQNGLNVCRKLRQAGSNTPLLMLTGRRQTTDKVIGLRMGADDYVTKPFQMAELLARIEALLRRAGKAQAVSAARYQFGDLQIDVRGTEVSRHGKVVPLSAKEFRLLRYFAEHPGATLSREELLREVWGYGDGPSTRTVDVHVAWLRRKLGIYPTNPQSILTVVGLGYKFAG
jgi:two-component system alkaline phosphatase synthesis response regulator PhoP